MSSKTDEPRGTRPAGRRGSNGRAWADALRSSVDPAAGRIPAFIFRDPDVYHAEIARIFERAWLFVAHRSELPDPGDYVTRSMGEQPVIVARGEDGRIRVFLNSCRHRGMQVCRSDVGNTSHFRCPYHGFTYTNSGQLAGVPFQQDAYPNGLDRSALSLHEARCEERAGLLFATWDLDGPSLDEYLGDMGWYLDVVFGRAEMEVLGPPQRYEIAGNWKLPAENFMSDNYHTASTHASIAEIGLVPGLDFSKLGYHIYAGNGHGLAIGTARSARQLDGAEGDTWSRSIFPDELWPIFKERLTPDQHELWLKTKQSNGNVFPSLGFLLVSQKYHDRPVSHTSLTLQTPLGPDRFAVSSWFLVERAAPDWWKEMSRQAFILSFGMSGIFSQDDSINYTAITAAAGDFDEPRIDLNYEMGAGVQPIEGFIGPGRAYDGKYNESNAREFYAHWLKVVTDGE